MFDAVVTGDAVGHGKPHPEPYLTAAAAARGRPSPTASPSRTRRPGVASAVAAGVPTIAVPHVVPVPRMAGAVQLPSLRGMAPADLLLRRGRQPGRSPASAARLGGPRAGYAARG